MAAEQRKLLEQLMGSDMIGSSQQQSMSFTSPKVCRSFLCGDCPHDMFTNTKMDLGPCSKIHSDKLKADYQKARLKKDYGFEYDYLRDLNKYIDDCNRRIESAQKRLEKTPEELIKASQLARDMAELEKIIDTSLEEVEILGEQGEVMRAVEEYHKIEKYKIDRSEREKELKSISTNSGSLGHQKLQVCDVCGAYLSRLDNDRRLADHFGGKLHMGYRKMRNLVIELKKELDSKKQNENSYNSSDTLEQNTQSYNSRNSKSKSRSHKKGNFDDKYRD